MFVGIFNRNLIRNLTMFSGLIFFILLHAGPVYFTWVGTWFYPLIWWTFIGLLEAWNLTRDRSLFLKGEHSFVEVALFSTCLWFVFEGYNLYLGNWYYVGVPESRFMRWFGTSISFATVLPGLWVVQRAIHDWLPTHLDQRKSINLSTSVTLTVVVAGLFFSVGPFFYPDLLFPFVWGGLLLVTDWAGYRLDHRSYIKQFTKGHYKQLISWLLSGLVCGILWEFWNSMAGAGWIYTVPNMGEWRVFEMPVLGFLGFPPFAAMAWRMYTFYADATDNVQIIGQVVFVILGCLFSISTLWAMDYYTYASTSIDPRDFRGWTQAEWHVINDNEIRTLQGLKKTFTGNKSARKVRFLKFAGLGTEIGNCLWIHDIRSIEEIKNTPTHSLARTLHTCRGSRFRFWLRRVKDWKQRG